MEIYESEIETEFEQLPLEQEQAKEICAVIFKVNNDKFGIDSEPYNLELFGKKMVDYVSNAVFDADVRYAYCNFGDDVLEEIKKTTNQNSKYTVVLFSDTPLFRHRTFLQIMEYFETKKLLALKLTRGYIFQTQYLMSLENLNGLQMQYFEEEDFVTCSSLKQFAFASDILKNRILDFFMKNGVVIKDPATTFIDAEVDILPNVVIEPFNTICGKTIIEKNVHLKPGNKLEDAIVCENSILDGADIKDSMVGKNCYISKGAVIFDKSRICDGVKIPAYSVFENVIVESSDELSSFAHYSAKED